jgi:hypothetical protein
METFIHGAGFAGAWLLVAGPLFQASVELRDESFDMEQFDAAKLNAQPPPVSGWWWLLPPVAYVKSRRRSQAHRDAMVRAMPAAHREQFVGLVNKANGWAFVAGGAFCIALKETWELVHLYEWPAALYWALVVVMSALAIANTVVRTLRADRMLHADDPGYRRRSRARRTPTDPPDDVS